MITLGLDVLLAPMTADIFLSKHWPKKPLFIPADIKKLNWVIFLLLFILLFDDLLYLQYTKTAIYLICSSILNIAWYSISKIKMTNRLLLWNSLLYAIGLLIRPQALYFSVK